jgi:hypothetical protein
MRFFIDDDEDFCYIGTSASVFYMKQEGLWGTICQRLKAAWFMLCGKEYRLHELVLSWEDYQNFADKIEKKRKEHEELLAKNSTENTCRVSSGIHIV